MLFVRAAEICVELLEWISFLLLFYFTAKATWLYPHELSRKKCLLKKRPFAFRLNRRNRLTWQWNFYAQQKYLQLNLWLEMSTHDERRAKCSFCQCYMFRSRKFKVLVCLSVPLSRFTWICIRGREEVASINHCLRFRLRMNTRKEFSCW